MILTAAQAVLVRGRNTVAMLMRRRDPARSDQEPAAPIRGELLNPDQLDQRARAIAATHTATLRAGDVRMLLAALDRNQRVIGAAHHTLSQDTGPREITPAAGSTWSSCCALSCPTSRSRRSRSASCGP